MIRLLFDDGTIVRINDATVVTLLTKKGLFKYVAFYQGKAFEFYHSYYMQIPLSKLEGMTIVGE